MIDAYVRAGNVSKALNLYDRARSEKWRIDLVTFSAVIRIHGQSGCFDGCFNVYEEMKAVGVKPNLVNQTDDVVRTFNRRIELGITPDERLCGCLLNVLTQTPKLELGKLISCIEIANPKLGLVVKPLVDDPVDGGDFKENASDLSVNLDLLERACELLELGLHPQIYRKLQTKVPNTMVSKSEESLLRRNSNSPARMDE